MTCYYLLYFVCCTLPTLSTKETKSLRTEPYPCLTSMHEIMHILSSIPESLQSALPIKRFRMLTKALHRNLDYTLLKQYMNGANENESMFLRFLIPHVRLRQLQIHRKAFFHYSEEEMSNKLLFDSVTAFRLWMADMEGFDVRDGMVVLRVPKRA